MARAVKAAGPKLDSSRLSYDGPIVGNRSLTVAALTRGFFANSSMLASGSNVRVRAATVKERLLNTSP